MLFVVIYGYPQGLRGRGRSSPPCADTDCEPRNVSRRDLFAVMSRGATAKPGPAASLEDVLIDGLHLPGASREPRDIAGLSTLRPRLSGASFDYAILNPFDILAVYALYQGVGAR